LSAEEQQRKADAAGQLNAAVADDAEIAAALLEINESVQRLRSQVDDAQRRLDEARETEQTAADEVATSSDQQVVIEQQLSLRAVEGFKSGADNPGLFFSDQDPTDTLRQEHLLAQTNKTTSELLEELRILREDSEAARGEAAQAAVDAEALEAQLTADLAALQNQQDEQLALKNEAESRIAQWESELSALAAEDASIQDLISDSSATDVVVNRATTPSDLGFQWPVEGTVTSPYGYRIHPVYGTRKLHSGIDVGAPGGTPISTAADGTVIFVGSKGGYGNTVIVDHGGGITTLYAHMSSFSTSDGASVARGDVIGGVGQTGTATGNHLHFEVRVDGATTDPIPYLP
jgi:murein DD-endopeptidase MepM/ murein hydrolase activator NlpD